MTDLLSITQALDGGLLLDDLDTLAQITAAGEGEGVNRIAYSPSDRAGRDWLESQMRALGMTTRTDAIGNTIGVYPGTDAALKPVALGSHTDTVPNSGKYDGALGVLGALACVRTLHQLGVRTRHPIEIIDFAAEEATLPGATFGSRGMVGKITPAALEQAAWDGRSSADVLRAAGFDLAGINAAVRPPGSLAAYLELHIEQGGILDKAGIPIGIVRGIVGIWRYTATFLGYANHAGTTPMADRRDALVAAAPFITLVQDLAFKHEIVGTVGSIRVQPNAPNVIPGRVELTLEMRSLDKTILETAEAELMSYAERMGAALTPVLKKPPVISDARLLDALRAASSELGLAYHEMASGAGHDAMLMADIAPMAMLFVPSVNGVSHSPDEYTSPEDCINGARVLLGALLNLDASFD